VFSLLTVLLVVEYFVSLITVPDNITLHLSLAWKKHSLQF